MLARDVRLEGFTTTDWVRLGEVLRPPADRPLERPDALGGSALTRRRAGVVAVVSDGRLRKLLSTRDGRLPLETEPWPAPLHDLASRHDARWAAELEMGALEELMDRFGERLEPEFDLLRQMLEAIAVLRELEAEGAVRCWPIRLAQWPLPSERMVLRALDAFCPDGKAVLIGVFEYGEVATCLAARRRGSGFDWIVGPDELRGEMGLTSGDWSRDYRHLARAVERRMGELALGCFGEMATFRRLAKSETPGAWAAAVASRDVIVSPLVPALAIPLGIDAGRAALVAMRGLAERIGASSWLEQAAQIHPSFELVREVALGDKSLESLLGFDPLTALRKLLSRGED